MRLPSLFLISFCILLFLSISDNSFSALPRSQGEEPSKDNYVPGQLIIKLKNTPDLKVIKSGIVETGLRSIDVLNSRYKVRSMNKLLDRHEILAEKTGKIDIFKAHGLDRIYLLTMPKNSDIADAMIKYKNDANVEYAEPNYFYYAALIPNDPSFPLQYGLHNTGQTNGIMDADIDAPEAWNISKTSNNIVIAVIDTGIDYLHDDLSSNIWRNTGEIPGNGIDDDNNGFIDDVYGWDFVNNDNDPFDDQGHGTHVAGIIAAIGNNGKGITGINWQAKLMAVKFLNSLGSGTNSDAIEAIQYAVLMGANITSNSWGSYGYSQALYNAISAADSADVLFVAAAGNDDVSNDMIPFYPASYNLSNIISVAATNHSDEKAWFSNHGSIVDIAAPGVDVLSTVPRGLCDGCNPSGYGYKSGTSMATPHVSGVLGLLLSQYSELDIKDAKAIIEKSGDSIASDYPIGSRLNAYKALLVRSIIYNAGNSRIEGYLLLKSQILSGTIWEDIGQEVDDLSFNNLRTIEPGSMLNLRQLYNSLSFIPTSAGRYRVFAKLTDINGNVLISSNGQLQDSYEFDVTTSTTSTTTSSTTTSLEKSKFYATSDTYVDEISPTQNFGTSSLLFTKGGTGSRRITYLKFNISSRYQYVESIYLVVRSASDMCSGTFSNLCVEFYRVPNPAWNENTINWNTRPSLDTFRLLGYDNIAANQNYSFYLSPNIIPSSGIFSFALSSINPDQAGWSSRESAYKPYIEITKSNASASSNIFPVT